MLNDENTTQLFETQQKKIWPYVVLGVVLILLIFVGFKSFSGDKIEEQIFVSVLLCTEIYEEFCFTNITIEKGNSFILRILATNLYSDGNYEVSSRIEFYDRSTKVDEIELETISEKKEKGYYVYSIDKEIITTEDDLEGVYKIKVIIENQGREGFEEIQFFLI